jgi:L-ascorbate metabolism protein UlaG (beta-lactamase superfamily)
MIRRLEQTTTSTRQPMREAARSQANTSGLLGRGPYARQMVGVTWYHWSMRITKYPQSCLVVDSGDARLLIDPGYLVLDRYRLADLGAVDAVLYTHQHADHFDPRALDELRERDVPVYGNADVSSLIGADAITVRSGQEMEIAGFSVAPHDLPHVAMVDGSPGPPNTGYLIGGRLFHPGDGFDIDLRVDVLALPIAGPSISFRDAYAFAERSGASAVIPMHYDFFLADPRLFAGFCDIARVVALDPGESVDL